VACGNHAPSLKAAIAAKHGPAYVSWHVLSSPLAIEMAAAAGWDAALIDQQHGIGDNQSLLDGLIAARAGGVPAVVRVGWNDKQLVSRALDAGASAIVCPMINSGAEAESFVKAAKYPPRGARSWGPYRAAMVTSGDYLTSANTETLAIAQIETRQAIENLDAILDTDGLDAALVGPNDLAISLTGERDIASAAVRDGMAAVLAGARHRGKLAWVFANDKAFAAERAVEDWDIITVATDARWLSAAAGDFLPT